VHNVVSPVHKIAFSCPVRRKREQLHFFQIFAKVFDSVIDFHNKIYSPIQLTPQIQLTPLIQLTRQYNRLLQYNFLPLYNDSYNTIDFPIQLTPQIQLTPLIQLTHLIQFTPPMQ